MKKYSTFSSNTRKVILKTQWGQFRRTVREIVVSGDVMRGYVILYGQKCKVKSTDQDYWVKE